MDEPQLQTKASPAEYGIQENITETEGLSSQLEEIVGVLIEKLQSVRNIKPSPAPFQKSEDSPLQSPIFMRILNINTRLRVTIETINHLINEVEL